MVKLAFDSQFKKSTGFFDYPKLRLEQGEKARICIIDSAPEAKYVHTIRRIILENGKPVMMEQTFGKNNERTREVPKTEFIGRFLCLGNDAPDGPLDTDEVDPDNCPACKAAVESAGAVEKAQRRIIFHVIRYKTVKGSYNISKPFQVELLAWDITDSRFSRLLEIKEEHGDLAGLDLNLGPCTNSTFQQFEVMPGAKAEWTQEADRQKYVKEVWEQNKSDDLYQLLGRSVVDAEMRGYVNDVIKQYNLGFGGHDVNAMPTVNTNAEVDFSEALGESSENPDFFAKPEFTAPVTDEAAAEDISEPAAQEEKAEEPKVENLDDLLKDFV